MVDDTNIEAIKSMSETFKTIETPIAHVELRPIFDHGDHCVVCSIYDADYYGAYAAPAGEPACRDEVFDHAGETLDYIFASPRYAGARYWYNGNEICIEITCADDVFEVLADLYCVDDKDYAELGEKLGFDAAEIEALTAIFKNKGP